MPDPDPKNDPSQGDPPPKDPPQGDPPPPKTFTQDEVTRIMTREKEEGRRAAIREVADKLGIENLDDAAEVLKKAKDEQDRQKSEAEREKEAAAKEKAQAREERRSATTERLQAKIERFLLRSGMAAEKVDRYQRLLDLTVVETDGRYELPTDEDIEDSIKTLKEESPELFGDPQGNGGKPPSSDPKGTPPTNRPSSGVKEKAKAMIDARKEGKRWDEIVRS